VARQRHFHRSGGTPLFFYDSFNDISGTGEFNDHWNITGDPANLHWSKDTPIPFLDADQFTAVEYDPVNELFHATGGANPTAQRCFDQAFRMGDRRERTSSSMGLTTAFSAGASFREAQS